jgi:hypothetical protein
MQRIFEMNYKKVLVLAVGGGNDSVSTLLLQLQLQKTFGYSPDKIDVVAVLPDCLDYSGMYSTDNEMVSIISSESQRHISGKKIKAFPERILAQNKNIIPSLNVNNIYGISMKKGSVGVLSGLKFLVSENQYDLVFGIDVGGDFIAHKDNLDVLSPMMDGYMLFALKELKKHIKKKAIKTEVMFSIFGLGTDGESTPEMLEKAIFLLPDIKEYSFCKDEVMPFINFYRGIVEKNRYSRTTDYTILEICGQNHDNPSKFRGRFHTKVNSTTPSKVYYGNFNHRQNESYYGKYYLFKDIELIDNVYSKKVNSGLEWFLNVQKQDSKINHELNGQSYRDIGEILDIDNLKGCSLLFATPSRKFNEAQQVQIIKDVNLSITNKVYTFAVVYMEYSDYIDESLIAHSITDDLLLVGFNKDKMLKLETHIKNIIK